VSENEGEQQLVDAGTPAEKKAKTELERQKQEIAHLK